MRDLQPRADALGALLVARRQTVAVAESSAGGLVSAALLARPGASAYFLGGGVIYTGKARVSLLAVTEADMAGLRPASEPYALLLARTIRDRLGATWGLAETGAAGPGGNRYGDLAGHSCVAVVGPAEVNPAERAATLATGHADRAANMHAFAAALLDLLADALRA